MLIPIIQSICRQGPNVFFFPFIKRNIAMYEHILQNISSLVFCIYLFLSLQSAHAMLTESEMKSAGEVIRVAAIDVSSEKNNVLKMETRCFVT